jgi:hypothetical protein
MKRIFFSILMMAGIAAQAQDKKEIQAIKNLCGCYEVQFMYAETFSPNHDYKLAKPYEAHGVEWVGVVESSDKKIVIQHLLQINDTTIIKHWREDWEFEKNGIWKFDHDAAWKFQQTKAEPGQWTQTVWEVDDAPRYQGVSRWINNNNQYYWQNTTDAPLPRREYSTRSDYNVLERTNKVIMTDTGWVHEQDNRKVLRKDGGKDTEISQEKGFNLYIKTDDSKCAAAANWWKQHKDFWNTVRVSWDEVLKTKTEVKLQPKLGGQGMSQYMSKLEKENLAEAERKIKARTIIEQFTAPASAAASVEK